MQDLDKELCFPDSVQMVDAAFSGSTTSVTWSGGAGTFYPNTTTLNAWYVPVASEIGTTVILTMTSDDPDGAGPCEPVSDQVAVIINNAPTVNAGLDKTICEGSSILMSDASYGGSATSITWSGGLGNFTPSTSTLLATYNPDTIETGSTVRLYIETNNPAGPCVAARDSVDIAIDIAPVVYAGSTKVICGQDSVRLTDASFGGSTTSVTWSGGTGTFYPNANTLNAVYFPTPGEIGTIVTLTISSNDPAGPCDIVTDQVDVNINVPPTADAGVDQIVCESSSIIVNGSIGGGASSATWSGGLGTFVNNNLLITEYIPDSTEIGTSSNY